MIGVEIRKGRLIAARPQALPEKARQGLARAIAQFGFAHVRCCGSGAAHPWLIAVRRAGPSRFAAGNRLRSGRDAVDPPLSGCSARRSASAETAQQTAPKIEAAATGALRS
ncbi:MAG TPA: hypothetical protein VJ770_04540 [Stellaceae bacterium]|nr:hypothetical protein [Stellaceae bacterium]